MVLLYGLAACLRREVIDEKSAVNKYWMESGTIWCHGLPSGFDSVTDKKALAHNDTAKRLQMRHCLTEGRRGSKQRKRSGADVLKVVNAQEEYE
jgi:hypothetical protein